MSKFYATISNNRSTITKCGHKDGLSAHIRGWNKGIRVEIFYDEKEKKETYMVFETGGSNKRSEDILIKEIIYYEKGD